MWGTLWAPSTTTKISCSWASLVISLIGLMSPTTFVIPAKAITFVFGVILFLTLSKVTWSESSKGIKLTTAPKSLHNLNHGITFDACSLVVIKISSPGSSKLPKKPVAIIFNESVAPLVNTISSLDLALIKFFTSSRAFSYSTSTLNDIS